MGIIFLYILTISSALLFSAAVTMIIVINRISRSNNIGESTTDFADYSPRIEDSLRLVDISQERASFFVTEHGYNPFENDNSRAPEPLRIKEEDDIFGDLPSVEGPLFAPLQDSDQ